MEQKANGWWAQARVNTDGWVKENASAEYFAVTIDTQSFCFPLCAYRPNGHSPKH